MCEVIEEATYVWHPQKKIAFIFLAMRYRGKVLLVDEKEVVRATTLHLLDEIGIEVVETASAELALAGLRSKL